MGSLTQTRMWQHPAHNQTSNSNAEFGMQSKQLLAQNVEFGNAGD
ncbi:hypothetical protein SAMN05444679_1391, partial [Variovorax sp. CF079]